MDFRSLRYFVAVAEELSFSRAARRLHVSQPPLSVQVKALEHELGAELFARTRRSVRLTQAGEVLLRHGRTALAELDRAAELTRLAGRGEAGTLSLGFTASVPLLEVFTRLLSRFRVLHPAAAVEVRLMSTGRQLHALAEGRLDIGIIRPGRDFRPDPCTTTRQIWEDRLFVFLPEGHRLLLRNAGIPMAGLAGERFVTFAHNIGCGLADELKLLCARAGFQPCIAHEVDVASSILGLVAAGEGVAVLPECQLRAGIVGVGGRPILPDGATSRLLLAHRANDQSPLLGTFLDVAEAVLAMSSGALPAGRP